MNNKFVTVHVITKRDYEKKDFDMLQERSKQTTLKQDDLVEISEMSLIAQMQKLSEEQYSLRPAEKYTGPYEFQIGILEIRAFLKRAPAADDPAAKESPFAYISIEKINNEKVAMLCYSYEGRNMISELRKAVELFTIKKTEHDKWRRGEEKKINQKLMGYAVMKSEGISYPMAAKVFAAILKTYITQKAPAPPLMCNFKPEKVRNIATTAEKTNKVFIYTDTGIAVSTKTGMRDFTWYHIVDNEIVDPVFMKANYDGTRLLIVARSGFYIIEKFTDSLYVRAEKISLNVIPGADNHFVKGITCDNLGVVQDLLFLQHPDYCIIAYAKHLVICNIAKRICVQVIDVSEDLADSPATDMPYVSENRIVSVKYHYPDNERSDEASVRLYSADIKELDHALFYMAKDGRLGVIFASEVQKDNNMSIPIYTNAKREIIFPNTKDLPQDQKRYFGRYASFDVIGNYIFYGTDNGQVVWTVYGKNYTVDAEKSNHVHLNIHELSWEKVNDRAERENRCFKNGGVITVNRTGNYIIAKHTYGITGFFVDSINRQLSFETGDSRRAPVVRHLIHCVGVIGYSNCQCSLFCVTASGYVVHLPNHVNGITRVDPQVLWEDKKSNERPMIQEISKNMNEILRRMKSSDSHIVEDKMLDWQEIEQDRNDFEEQTKKMEEALNRQDRESKALISQFDDWVTEDDKKLIEKLKELKALLEKL